MENEELSVEVDVTEMAEAPITNPMVKRVTEDIKADQEDKSFEQAIKVESRVLDEHGNSVAFDPSIHVAFALKDGVRDQINELVDQPVAEAEKVLKGLVEEKKINSYSSLMLTQLVSAEANPGHVTLVLNFDKTVNSVHVE